MSRFHSTVSRRDFMKGLGLAGAGIGAAAAAPVFHDLDEAMASPQAVWRRPWWVKEREFENPTVEIDWDLVQNTDQMARMYELDATGTKRLFAYRSTIYRGVGAEVKDRLGIEWTRKQDPNWQGDSLRSQALKGALKSGVYKGKTPEEGGTECFLGTQKAKTPEAMGLPKWQGTLEENMRMMRTVVRFAGGTDVGAVEITPNTRKLLFTRHRPDWKAQVIEDVDQAYETDEKLVIPSKAKWLLFWTVLQPFEATHRYGALSGAGSGKAYQDITIIENRIQEFLRGIGYQGLAGGTGCIGPSNAWGVMAGIGEMSRAYHVITSPEWGNDIRGMNRMITDLPLTPTRPIDAGAARFCRTCMKCADACPSDSISREREPTWEHPTAPYKMNPALEAHSDMLSAYSGWRWNVSGIKAWWLDVPTCTMCRQCMGSCVYSKLDNASIHEVVKAISATTSVFNSFFRTMDDAFGYGLKDPAEFWELDLPAYGIDTTRGAKRY